MSWLEAYSLFKLQWVGPLMRLLFAVVHYYKAGDGRHGSPWLLTPSHELMLLRHLILQLHRLYGQPAGLLNHRHRRVDGVDDGGGLVDLRVCVSGDCHVLDRLSDCEGLYRARRPAIRRIPVCLVLKRSGCCSRPFTRLKTLVSL